jgi:hypothetical protein
MTVSTTAATSAALSPGGFGPIFYAPGLLLPGIVFAQSNRTRKRWRKNVRVFTLIALLLLLLLLTACAGVSSSSGGRGQPGTPSGTYKIVVTGTSPGTPADAGQSTQVTLVVN